MSEDETPLNILCLDGGGVRGLSSLLILRDLMQTLKVASKFQEVPLPCDVFDLICGTSTGGLIAIMLGRLRMRVQEAIAEYIDFSKTVFEERRTMSPPLGFLTRSYWDKKSHSDMDPMYDSSKLEKWMIKMVAKYDRSGNGQASLADPDEFRCRMFVLAVTQAYADSPPKHFRSYSTESHIADTCKIWEAARATTAAFPFFEAAKIGFPGETFIDGSFSGSNNPSLRAIEEVSEIFPSRKIACFLSLGTGVPKVISVRGGREQVAEACRKLIQSCETTHDAVGRAFDNSRVPAHGEPYFRFSVNRGLEDVELDEWNRLEELTSITSGYMRHRDQEKLVKKCLQTLVPRAPKILTTEESSLL